MSGDRNSGADTDELLFRVLGLGVAEHGRHMHAAEEWLRAKYREVWAEGHAEGVRDAQVGGVLTRNPYGR